MSLHASPAGVRTVVGRIFGGEGETVLGIAAGIWQDGGVKGRFEIDEIVAQDKGGVVFRALDRTTGRAVALRRLLPRGRDGGGLNRQEAGAYVAAAERLATLREEGLRSVVGWGVDEVDGMPWLASEWSDGESLASVMRRGQLSVEAGRMLVEQGLAVQVEIDARAPGWRLATDPDSVVVEMAEDDFRFTWWVEPFPGPEGRARGVAAEIAALVESALRWKGLALPPGAGGGLADWIRRVRSERLTAAGALAALAGTAGGKTAGRAETPPLRSTAPGHVPPQTVAVPAKPGGSRSKGLVMLAAGLLMLAAGGTWWATRSGHRPAVPAGEAKGPGDSSQEDQIAERARELARAAAAGESLGEMPVFRSDDVERVRQLEGQRVAVTGVLALVRESSSGKSRYLEFSEEDGAKAVCGRFWTRDVPASNGDELKRMIGKVIRIEGDVRLEGGTGRVVVHLTKSSRVTVVEGD